MSDKTTQTAELVNNSPVTASQLPTISAGLGVNQTWQNVVAQRSYNTNFVNNTGKPIVVSLTAGFTAGHGVALIVDGVWVATTSGNSATIIYGTVSGIVPNGSTYSVTFFAGSAATTQYWAELR